MRDKPTENVIEQGDMGGRVVLTTRRIIRKLDNGETLTEMEKMFLYTLNELICADYGTSKEKDDAATK